MRPRDGYRVSRLASAGVGLPECLVALLVFAPGLAGALSVLLQAQRQATEAILGLRALGLGEEWLARASLHTPLRAHLPTAQACNVAASCAESVVQLTDWWQRAAGSDAAAALPAPELCARHRGEGLELLLSWQSPLTEQAVPTALGMPSDASATGCVASGQAHLRLRAFTVAGS